MNLCLPLSLKLDGLGPLKCLVFNWSRASQNCRSAVRFSSSGIDLNVLVACKSRVLGCTSKILFCFVLWFNPFAIRGFSLPKQPYLFMCTGLMDSFYTGLGASFFSESECRCYSALGPTRYSLMPSSGISHRFLNTGWGTPSCLVSPFSCRALPLVPTSRYLLRHFLLRISRFHIRCSCVFLG